MLSSDAGSRRTSAIALAAFLAVALVANAAEWYRDYDMALERLEAGEFESAIKLLESAISSGQRPGSKVRRYGMIYSSFYPHYYLGKAYQGLGNRDMAVQSFQTSTAMGELEDEPDLVLDRDQQLSRLRETPPPPPSTVPVAPVETPPQDPSAVSIEEEASFIEGLIRDGETAEAGEKLAALRSDSGRSGSSVQVQARLAELQNRLENRAATAGKDVERGRALLERKEYDAARAALERAIEVDSAAQRARELLDRLNEEERVAASAKAVAEAVARAAAAVRTHLRRGDLAAAGAELLAARKTDPESSSVQALADELASAQAAERFYQDRRYEEARQRFENVLSADPQNTWADGRLARIEQALRASEEAAAAADDAETDARGALDPIRRHVENGEIRLACETLEEIALPPDDPELRILRTELQDKARTKVLSAVREMFRGKANREAVISNLEDARAALDDRPTLHLYLAWAYYGSYLRGHEEDSTLVEKARGALRRALALDQDLTPDPNLISPRLRDLLAEVRAEVKP